MAGPVKIGSTMGGWTVKALEKDGSAPRYSADLDGQAGTLTYYPLMGPRTIVHQTLGARLKRWDKLTHENLVKVAAGRAGEGGRDAFFIVVPNLEKVHKLGKPPLQAPEALKVLKAAAGALGAFEVKGIAHGELDPWCMVKKADAGYALLGPGLRVPPPGVDKLGLDIDPSYAAPEVLDGQDPTLVSDFFSLGLVLFRLVTGKRPVNAKEPSGAFAERGKVPAPSLAQAPVPGPVKALYAKLVAHDKRQRPQSVRELQADIDMAAKGKNPSPNTPVVPNLEPDRIGGAAAALVLLLAIAGGLYYTATQVLAISNPLDELAFPIDGKGYSSSAAVTSGTEDSGKKDSGTEDTGKDSGDSGDKSSGTEDSGDEGTEDSGDEGAEDSGTEDSGTEDSSDEGAEDSDESGTDESSEDSGSSGEGDGTSSDATDGDG